MMENNQERLDEVKAVLAERHQMPIEEISRMIDGVIVVFVGVEEGLKPIVKGLSRLWNSMKEIILENHEKALWNTENEAMHGWKLDWDTRKCSQVIDRKPQHMVRKIIR